MGKLLQLGQEVFGPELPPPPAGQEWVSTPQGTVLVAKTGNDAGPTAPGVPWLDQEMIVGVPNKWLLGGSAGVLFLLTALRRRRR